MVTYTAKSLQKIPQLHMKYMEFHNTFSLMKKEKELDMKPSYQREMVIL